MADKPQDTPAPVIDNPSTAALLARLVELEARISALEAAFQQLSTQPATFG